MLRPILQNGLIAGMIVGVPMVILSVFFGGLPKGVPGMVVGYTTMLLAFAVIFLAVKRQRDATQGGAIRFWPALALGLGISAVASLVYVLSWELSLAVTGTDFAADYTRGLIEARKAKGASAEELAAFTAQMEKFQADYANPLYRLPVTFSEIFPVGALVSLVSAGLLRNPRFMPARRA
jgi:hypothetical protein